MSDPTHLSAPVGGGAGPFTPPSGNILSFEYHTGSSSDGAGAPDWVGGCGFFRKANRELFGAHGVRYVTSSVWWGEVSESADGGAGKDGLRYAEYLDGSENARISLQALQPLQHFPEEARSCGISGGLRGCRGVPGMRNTWVGSAKGPSPPDFHKVNIMQSPVLLDSLIPH